MREPEQFVVPALGILVLLSVFILGSAGFYSMAYLIILGLLGLAAVGTYFPPPAVQVELRVAIAALGLIVLIFMFSSLGFWLALIGFGAIGALQIRHRRTLQTQLHTIEWLKTMQSGQEGAFELSADEETGEAGGAAATQPRASRGGGSVNIGGVGAAVLGIIVLLSAMMPWATISADFGFFGSSSATMSGWEFTQELNREGDSPLPYGLAGIIAVLAIVGIVSIALPRVVPAIAGILGVVVMAFIFLVFSEYGGGADLASYGVAYTFGIGFWLATLAFLLMAVLQLIPRQKN